MFNVNIIKDTPKDNLVKWAQDLEKKYINTSTLKQYQTKYNEKNIKKEQMLNNVCIIPWSISNSTSKQSEAQQLSDLEDRMPSIINERKLHSYENLNQQQADIFDYVIKHNRYGITLVQAGPGTGKTFTMLTIAHYLMTHEDRANSVIYKNDLVAVYRFCAHGFSLAKFFMIIFNIRYGEYESLEMKLCSSMSVEHFTNVILQLLCRVKLVSPIADFYNNLLILDEYTVIPKPLLLILLLVLDRYKIGAVICGDRNQLQNIHNTNHAGKGSSYDFVRIIANREFALSRNHRCSDVDYNNKVQMLSEYSSSQHLDDWANALIGAMFYKNFLNRIDKQDIILASNHIDMSIHMDMLVKSENITEEIWLIEKVSDRLVKGVEKIPNSGLFYPNPTIRYGTEILKVPAEAIRTGQVYSGYKKINERNCPGKFLPYIPLIVGQTYFVHNHSELCLGDLKKITFAADGSVQYVTMQMHDTQKYITLKKNNKCKDVMFDKHSIYLLNNGKDHVDRGETISGKLYNFPIYPAFQMSVYMSQGRTVSKNVSFIFNKATYQGLYVAASRITSHTNVNAVIIPNSTSLLFSTIINFDTSAENGIGVDYIKHKLVENPYKLYELPLTNQELLESVAECIVHPDVKVRRQERENVLKIASTMNLRYKIVMPKEPPKDDTDPTLNATIGYIMRYRKTIYALTCVESLIDRHLWQRMFFIKMMDSIFENVRTNRYTCNSDFGSNVLTRICGFKGQNLLVGENNLIDNFVKCNFNIIYTDTKGQVPPNIIPVDDKLKQIETLKPNLPYKCLNLFTWKLMTGVNLDKSKEIVCEKLYQLLSEYLAADVLLRKRKTTDLKDQYSQVNVKKFKIVNLS